MMLRRAWGVGPRVLVLSGALVVLAQGASGQVAEPAAERPKPWRAQWTVGVGSSYDHNPFRLSAGQRDDLVDVFRNLRRGGVSLPSEENLPDRS